MRRGRAQLRLFAAALAAPADPLPRPPAGRLTFRDIQTVKLAKLRIAVEAAIDIHPDLGEPHLALVRSAPRSAGPQPGRAARAARRPARPS